MNKQKIGVWLIGALGSIASTMIIGALTLRKGLTEPTGMVTATGAFTDLDLIDLNELVFGGCDIRSAAPSATVRQVLAMSNVDDPSAQQEIEAEFTRTLDDIGGGTVTNCGEAIQDLAANTASGVCSLHEEISRIREALRTFKQQRSLRDIVVVNLASTEPPLELRDCHQDLDTFELSLEQNRTDAVRASSLYAYAAVREGCPYLNFTPSTGALLPAIIQLAESNGVPVMGNDGKTGETLVKSALAPMFGVRNLHVLSWEGFNILGNMDGSILDHADNRAAKIRTKDRVLAGILGYHPHSRVHIDYVPSLDDQKTAWDFIHFEGFLGAKMSLQFIWQGFDSMLAAPLVLDLVRLAEFAKRRGERGVMPHLASFFKAPLGVDEFRLAEQHRLLLNYAEQAGSKKSAPAS